MSSPSYMFDVSFLATRIFNYNHQCEMTTAPSKISSAGPLDTDGQVEANALAKLLNSALVNCLSDKLEDNKISSVNKICR